MACVKISVRILAQEFTFVHMIPSHPVVCEGISKVPFLCVGDGTVHVKEIRRMRFASGHLI